MLLFNFFIMRQTIFSIVIILCAYSGCKKDSDTPSIGTLTVKVNGIEWTGKVRMVNQERFSIVVDKYKSISGVEVPWEILSLSLLNKNNYVQRLYIKDVNVTINPDSAKTYASFGTMQEDGCVGCDNYQVIETDSVNNWFQITEQRNNYSEIWGKFCVSFYRVLSCSTSIYPDTLKFREGAFHLQLK
jgi:hypothetical protein